MHADLLDNGTHGRAHRHFDQPGVPHVAGQSENLRPLAPGRADAGEPLGCRTQKAHSCCRNCREWLRLYQVPRSRLMRKGFHYRICQFLRDFTRAVSLVNCSTCKYATGESSLEEESSSIENRGSYIYLWKGFA